MSVLLLLSCFRPACRTKCLMVVVSAYTATRGKNSKLFTWSNHSFVVVKVVKNLSLRVQGSSSDFTYPLIMCRYHLFISIMLLFQMLTCSVRYF